MKGNLYFSQGKILSTCKVVKVCVSIGYDKYLNQQQLLKSYNKKIVSNNKVETIKECFEKKERFRRQQTSLSYIDGSLKNIGWAVHRNKWNGIQHILVHHIKPLNTL